MSQSSRAEKLSASRGFVLIAGIGFSRAILASCIALESKGCLSLPARTCRSINAMPTVERIGIREESL